MRFQVATRISFWRREISSCWPPPPPPPPPPPCVDWREAAIERLHLDEEQVGLRLAAAVFGDRVVRDHVAGLERAELRGLRRRRASAGELGSARLLPAPGSSGGRCPRGRTMNSSMPPSAGPAATRVRLALLRAGHACGLLQVLEEQRLAAEHVVAVDVERGRLPFAAVDRIAQLDAVEPEIVARLDAHGDFFDVARAPVAARLHTPSRPACCRGSARSDSRR